LLLGNRLELTAFRDLGDPIPRPYCTYDGAAAANDDDKVSVFLLKPRKLLDASAPRRFDRQFISASAFLSRLSLGFLTGVRGEFDVTPSSTAAVAAAAAADDNDDDDDEDDEGSRRQDPTGSASSVGDLQLAIHRLSNNVSFEQ